VKLSVIIPALDEAARIGSSVASARALAGVHEVIVVDGGSCDETARIAAAAGARVVACDRGRGRQQNAGARAATGDSLVFLHADVELPANAAAIIDAQLASPGVVAGAFRAWHKPERWRGARAALLHFADLRSRYSPLPYGDQAIHMRAAMFDRIGGFAELELMEDLELSRRLRRLGRIAIARESVAVSARRFESAAIYQTALVNVFPLLYFVGVPASFLARLYGNPR